MKILCEIWQTEAAGLRLGGGHRCTITLVNSPCGQMHLYIYIGLSDHKHVCATCLVKST